MTDQDHEDYEAPVFSRTGYVGPFGALIQPVKTLVDFETEQLFRQVCHHAGTDVATARNGGLVDPLRSTPKGAISIAPRDRDTGAKTKRLRMARI